MTNLTQIITISTISLLSGICIGMIIAPSIGANSGSRYNKRRQTKSRPIDDSSSTTTSPSLTEDSDEDEYYEDESDEEIEINSETLNDIPGEVKMALVVRRDLKMGKGKAAAQCAHAALGLYRLMSEDGSEAKNPTLLMRWLRAGQPKITLQCDDEGEMDLLFAKAMSLNINCTIIHDAGRTQIAAGSATVIGLGPAPKLALDQVTRELKLY